MDTRDINAQNLLFLLSAAPIGLGCIITDGDDDTGGDTTPTTSVGATDDGGTTAGDDGNTTAGDQDGGMTTSGGVETESADGATTMVDPTATGGETDTGGKNNPVCVAYADAVTYCYTKRDGLAALEYCEEYTAYLYKTYGDACVSAFEEFLTCLSGLTCKELMGAEPVCVPESEAVDVECAPA